MSAPNLNAHHRPDEMQLIEVVGGWIVRVVENGLADRRSSHKLLDRLREDPGAGKGVGGLYPF
ncbi:hypothetical protein MesoLjLc_32170 [Mesorhizobium sp. L-8-10]|nr:hypothetical protein MesoLjLb_32920 [Mesorhizobium sp. L-8-3]BCH31287.1 hypothetical protein MesoLjLc_32170 [Mesorhizobium sp. L-8-10]